MTLIDHSRGFASNDDMAATGVTTFNGGAADLTVNSPDTRASSRATSSLTSA